MDLFVWFGETDQIVGFQLAYDKPHMEKVITWKRQGGFLHSRIDDGSRAGRHPSAPLMVGDGAFQATLVLNEFRQRAMEIDMRVAAFVAKKVAEFPR